jgi:hypothetical protein
VTRAAALASLVATLFAACDDAREAAAMETTASPTRHAEPTPANLASITDDAVEQAVLDHVTGKIGGDLEHRLAILARLPIGAQATYITSTVERNVRAGGFEKFYAGEDAPLANQAAEAFEFFSAHEHAALMREANAVRAMDAERVRLQRPGASQLGPLDRRFAALKEDMSALRIAKIRAMPEFFAEKP